MIQKYVDRFMANKTQLESFLKKKHPEDYKQLVTEVVKVISTDDYGDIDPERVTEIDYGDYQGTLLYVIAAKGYQPGTFWTMKVDYGSCSGCDTLQAISDYSNKPPTQKQIEQYTNLALNLVQSLKSVDGECA